jgi:hypothetical protein
MIYVAPVELITNHHSSKPQPNLFGFLYSVQIEQFDSEGSLSFEQMKNVYSREVPCTVSSTPSGWTVLHVTRDMVASLGPAQFTGPAQRNYAKTLCAALHWPKPCNCDGKNRSTQVQTPICLRKHLCNSKVRPMPKTGRFAHGSWLNKRQIPDHGKLETFGPHKQCGIHRHRPVRP